MCCVVRFSVHFRHSCCLPGAILIYNGKSKFRQLTLVRSVNRHYRLFSFAGESPLQIAAREGPIEIVELISDRVQSRVPLTVRCEILLCLACGWKSPDAGEPQLLKYLLSRDGRARNISVFLPQFCCQSKTVKKQEKKRCQEILVHII